MANASLREHRPGLRMALGVGLLTAASLLIGASTVAAQAKKPAPAAPAVNPATVLASEQIKAINELIDAQWKANKITPSALCTDYEFVRRASLDIIGRIAKPEEVTRFLQDPPQLRRAMLIERLLSQKDSDGNLEYAQFWAGMWTNWLMTRSATVAYRDQMYEALKDHLSNGGTHRDMVTNLLTAKGKNNENGFTNFILQHLGEPIPATKRGEEGFFEMVPITSRTTKLFLGYQTQCTQCHDHPFNPDWHQKHFWGVNAFFRQVERGGTPLPPNKVAKLGAVTLTLMDNDSVNGEGMVYFERRNGIMQLTKAQFLDGKKPASGSQLSRREHLSQFVVNHDNFGKAYVNRLWGHFFGRGLNEQPVVDDFGEHNALVHPELLDRLAADFAGTGGYDPKNLIRWICNSRPYNLSCTANSTNAGSDAEVFFSRMVLKNMSPEQLFESLQVATTGGTKDADSRDRWLRSLTTNFGDDEGNEVTFNGTVVQALMLINGNDINNAINAGSGTVAKAMKKGNAQAVMNDLYIAALNRRPSAGEVNQIVGKFRMRVQDRDAAAPWQDLFWALLNSSEFILNH
jgi:hypothetical protein